MAKEEKAKKEEKKAKKLNFKSMQEAMDESGDVLVPIKEGQMTDVTITKMSKNRILVDVQGLNSGFIPEKEFSSDILDLEEGDVIPACVLMVENDNGDVVLSLKRASKERYWKTLAESYSEKKTIKIRVKQANRGGLIAEYGNIDGFLPVSQLNSNHYPRVGDNKDKILEKLRSLVGNSLEVRVINLDAQSSKVIFSEKAAGDKALEQKIDKYKIGDKLTGNVTGIVDFGMFVDVGNIEGLVHISEISWDKVEDINNRYKVGDKVEVEIIDISNNRLSFSVKRLKKDPWLDKVSDYKVDSKVKGKVTKITPYGAFVSLSKGLNAMFHISELLNLKSEGVKSLDDLVEVGKEYNFVIKSIEKESHKINLKWPEKKKSKKK